MTEPDPAALAQFSAITGADAATAGFFLAAARGDNDAAVSAFFESGGIMPAPPPSARPAATSRAPPPPPQAPAQGRRAPRARAPRGGGMGTIGSLREDDSDDDESGKNYYAGGEKSGQMIQDPRKRGGAGPSNPDGGADGEEPEDIAEAIFERARARGPRTDEEREQFTGEQNFTGAGYRLGDTEQNNQPAAPAVVGRRNVTRSLTFYANGFTIDEGPLRRFDDPNNEAFLADVNRGVVPREMEEPGIGNVSITLIDKKGEEYVPQKQKRVAFSGGGQRLSEAPPVAATGEVDAAGAAATLAVDESRPVATVQVRLSDGTRLMARLNEDHTVGQLRRFVAASRPGVPSFTLSTTFPRKVLSDDAATIKEAQLKGAVVVQTLK